MAKAIHNITNHQILISVNTGINLARIIPKAKQLIFTNAMSMLSNLFNFEFAQDIRLIFLFI
jgi:hypothetical protein